MNVGEVIGYDSDRLLKDLVCLRFIPPQGYRSVARDAVALQETLSPLLSENASDVGVPVLEELKRITGNIGDWLNRPLHLGDRLRFRELLDNYEQVEWAYEGSFSVVFKAETYEGETVALKIPKPSNRFAESAFMAEIEAHVDLKRIGYDENLVPMRKARFNPYLCMEMDWLSGRNLADHIEYEDGPFPYKEALGLVFGVARGVAKAHAWGRIHLDINPQNIVFKGPTRASQAVLVDWGLSSMETPAGFVSYADRFRMDRDLSPEYAAPEQLDARFGLPCRKTDVYRLALVAYELLTGSGREFRRLRRTSDQAIEFEPIAPSEHPNTASGFPQGLDKLVIDGLRRNVSERSTLDQFGGGLAEILGTRWRILKTLETGHEGMSYA